MYRRIKILFFFFLILAFGPKAEAQTDPVIGFNPETRSVHTEDISKLSPIQLYEDSLVYVADSMYNNAIPENRTAASNEFIRLFRGMLKIPGSFSYPFPKLQKFIVILNPDDNAFRLYNWEVARDESNKRYYGVLQFNDGNYKPLIDVSDKIIRGGEDSVFSTANNRWYGCLYYNLMKQDIAGQPFYFLFGKNSNSMNSDKKLIEVLSFDSQGQGVFGANLFTTLERGVRKNPKRFIYEYLKGAVVGLNYDKETQQIIFDHCESQIGDPAKKYTYIPDGTYDGMRWTGQQWLMQENIIQIQILENGQAPLDKPIK